MRITPFRVALLLLFCSVLAVAAQSQGPPAPGRATPLFDGRTLAGWEGNPNVWRVEDSALTGGMPGTAQPVNEFLASVREFSDFVLRFQIKLTGSEGFVNSGMQIRSQRQANSSEMVGYQCDYGDPDWWGGLYDESRRNKVLAAANIAMLGPAIRRGDWNDYVIRAEGPRITTWLNGVMGVDYRETDPSIPQSGKLGIQLHSGGKAVVQVRNIAIEDLRRQIQCLPSLNMRRRRRTIRPRNWIKLTHRTLAIAP